MNEITIEHDPSPAKLEAMGVFEWDIWSAEVSRFPWHYTAAETCYLLGGEVTVIPDATGEAVRFGRGDLVHFPAGMSCTWEIHAPVRKHFKLGP